MDEHEDFEGGVIGALLLAGEMGDGSDASRVMSAYSNKGMDETWFRNVTWKKLWNAVKAEFDEHHGVDQFLVANRFGNGGMAAVARAIECCGQVSYAEYYCMKLRDVHLYHLAHKMCMQVVQNGKPGSVSQDLDELAKGLREIQGLAAKADGGLKKVGELVAPVMDEMRILSDERFVKKTGASTSGCRCRGTS